MGRILYSNYSSFSLSVGTDDEGVEDVLAAELSQKKKL